MMPKKDSSKIVAWVRVEYDAKHVKPSTEAYPDLSTLRECLEYELKMANGEDGQGDYLSMLMSLETARTEVVKMVLKQHGKKPITVRAMDAESNASEDGLQELLERPDNTPEIKLNSTELGLHKKYVQKIKGLGGYVLGIHVGPGKPTCMYFPWSASDKTFYGVDVSYYLEKMKEVGGGLKKIHEAVTERSIQYRGWSDCRVCQCMNGSEENVLCDGMVVPEGARHYKTAHKVPLNLWSMPVNKTTSLYYIAKRSI